MERKHAVNKQKENAMTLKEKLQQEVNDGIMTAGMANKIAYDAGMNGVEITKQKPIGNAITFKDSLAVAGLKAKDCNRIGQVVLYTGDVVTLTPELGGPVKERFAVITVNESGAKVVSLGALVNRDRVYDPERISATICPTCFIERMGQDWLDNFQAAIKKPSRGSENKQKQGGGENEGTTMSKSTIEKPIRAPRGGLAAEAMAAKNGTKEPKAPKAPKVAKVKAEGPQSRGKLGEIHGSSTTSVLRSLGYAGCSVARAKLIMAAKGVAVAPATCQIQVNNGKNWNKSKEQESTEKYGKLSTLTKDQVNELLALAEEPAAPAAEAKAPKVKKEKAGKKAAKAATTEEKAPEASATATATE